eukprot:m.53108 g.53108  ORF g.53108 m.53108 type:complete len:95 (-) comp10841_c0_seq2:666-950(-)
MIQTFKATIHGFDMFLFGYQMIDMEFIVNKKVSQHLINGSDRHIEEIKKTKTSFNNRTPTTNNDSNLQSLFGDWLLSRQTSCILRISSLVHIKR